MIMKFYWGCMILVGLMGAFIAGYYVTMPHLAAGRPPSRRISRVMSPPANPRRALPVTRNPSPAPTLQPAAVQPVSASEDPEDFLKDAYLPFVECLSWDEYAAALLNQGTAVDMVDQIQETCDLRAYPALPPVQTPLVKDVVCLEHLAWDMVATLLSTDPSDHRGVVAAVRRIDQDENVIRSRSDPWLAYLRLQQ